MYRVTKVVRDKLSFRANVTTVTAPNQEIVPNHFCHPLCKISICYSLTGASRANIS